MPPKDPRRVRHIKELKVVEYCYFERLLHNSWRYGKGRMEHIIVLEDGA
jgi:hypothetical protein